MRVGLIGELHAKILGEIPTSVRGPGIVVQAPSQIAQANTKQVILSGETIAQTVIT